MFLIALVLLFIGLGNASLTCFGPDFYFDFVNCTDSVCVNEVNHDVGAYVAITDPALTGTATDGNGTAGVDDNRLVLFQMQVHSAQFLFWIYDVGFLMNETGLGVYQGVPGEGEYLGMARTEIPLENKTVSVYLETGTTFLTTITVYITTTRAIVVTGVTVQRDDPFFQLVDGTISKLVAFSGTVSKPPYYSDLDDMTVASVLCYITYPTEVPLWVWIYTIISSLLMVLGSVSMFALGAALYYIMNSRGIGLWELLGIGSGREMRFSNLEKCHK